MKKILLTIYEFILRSASRRRDVLTSRGLARTIVFVMLFCFAISPAFAANDRLPETMVGQTTATQNALNYYGGFPGNQAVYNYTNDATNPSGPSGQSAFITTPDAEKMLVAVGLGKSANAIATSHDGASWTSSSQTVLWSGYGVAYNGRVWVVVGLGTNNTIATSTDGINWTGRGKSVLSSYGIGVAWNGSLFVAVGGGTNSIATSPDGITWTGRGNTIINGIGVASNGSMWVVVGNSTDNSIATSLDGITWTGQGKSLFSDGASGVAWNGSLFVAVGGGPNTNSIATSPDGITWTVRSSNATFCGGKGVAWNGSQFVAVGACGTNYIATSPDGITWTGRGKPVLDLGIFGVASNGSSFAAVGEGLGTNYTLATSPDGITWTGKAITIGGGVASNSSALIDANTVTYSTGYDLFGFDQPSLTDSTTGCINDIVFHQSANRCFFSNSRNGNVKVMSSRTYVNSGNYLTPVMELASLYYPPKGMIVGDAYLGGMDPNSFAYWGRNLVQSTNAPNSDSFWGMAYTNNSDAQASLNVNGTEFKQYATKITELSGEAMEAINYSPTTAAQWYLQKNDNIIIISPNDVNNYPQGKVWKTAAGGLTLTTSKTFSGKGTIIVNGDLTINPGVTLKPVDANSMLGFIVTGDIILKGNNTVSAAMFAAGTSFTVGSNIVFNGDNVDLIGSFVAKRFINLTSSDVTTELRSNIRFYYDKKLDASWPPGFGYLNMPHPSEN